MTQYAEQRAKELVKLWLSRKEYESLMHEGCLRIKSKIYPDREYTLWGNPHSNIHIFENGNDIGRLCVKLKEKGFPKWDVFLSKVLYLKADEEGFLKIANNIGR